MTLSIFDCPYRSEIMAAMHAYLPTWDYLWGVAQLYQESHWDPAALNKDTGAAGIAQFMPDTEVEIFQQLGFPHSATAYDPVYAIPAYAYYMKKMCRTWTSKRSDDERRRLAQASYNCGAGNMIAAQALTNMALDYATIIAALPQITGVANAEQTSDYVAKIQRWYTELST